MTIGGSAAPSWPDLLTRLLAGEHLAPSDTRWAMDRVMSGEASPAQLAAFAVALRAKGETAEEVAGLAESMLGHAVDVPVAQRVVDIVGTGGDRANTVNISTMASVVIAAAGAPVVKHGNRAASSACGSADLLEAMGVAISLGPADVQRCLAEVGIAFCFAPVYHPGYRHAGPPRREMGIPTVFNYLGPLTNPARPAAGAIGCGSAAMAPVMAGVFARRDVDVLLFRGDDGLDELTTTTTSTVWVVSGGEVRTVTLDPQRLGIEPVAADELVGGDPGVNLAAARQIFAGAPHPARSAVLLNAAAALAAFESLDGVRDANAVEQAVAAGLQRAEQAIDSGAAAELADKWAVVSTQLAAASAG